MEETKKRDFMFDAFRGLLIWCIPISHFTRVAGHFSAASLGGIVYITINVFVMQAFVFLSGYFSKKPDRARQTAFKTFLWPYILCIPFFYFVKLIIFGHASINLLVPPFALWYLFALFFYRFFLKDYIKIPHIVEISVLIYLIAGLIPFLSKELALGRMFSYFPFFLLGYYCTPEHLAKLRSLKKVHCVILAVILVAVSCLLAFKATQFPVGFYLLKEPAVNLGMAWYWDIIGRIMIFVLACGWILLMINILPNRKNYLTYVGMNTMPVYILHLVVRYLVEKYGITFGILPDNWVVYYLMIFGLASLCVVVFSSKPVAKAYDFVVDGSYKIFIWLLDKLQVCLGVIHEPILKFINRLINSVYKLGNSGEKKSLSEGAGALKSKFKFSSAKDNSSAAGGEHSSSDSKPSSKRSKPGRFKKSNKTDSGKTSFNNLEIELEGLENLSAKPVTKKDIISMGFSEFGGVSDGNSESEQTAMIWEKIKASAESENNPDIRTESDSKETPQESSVSLESHDNSAEGQSRTSSDEKPRKNSDRKSDSNSFSDEASADSDNSVSPDSGKSSNTVQETASEESLNPEDQKVGSGKKSNPGKKVRSGKKSNFGKNSNPGKKVNNTGSVETEKNNSSYSDTDRSNKGEASAETGSDTKDTVESPELSFFDISDIDAYLKSKNEESSKKEKSEDKPNEQSSSDKA